MREKNDETLGAARLPPGVFWEPPQHLLDAFFRGFLIILFLLVDGGFLVLLIFSNLPLIYLNHNNRHTRSCMLLSASVNSISSIPSPVYQCYHQQCTTEMSVTKKALRRNIALNCSPTRLNSSWIDVELPINVEDIFNPRGGTLQVAVRTLLGIHSTTKN